ncbi:MAG: alpha/beta fold hydrolase [Bradymonadia bacterium]
MTDTAPAQYDLRLPDLVLEGGARVAPHVARVWIHGPTDERDLLDGLGARVASEPGTVVRRAAGEAPARPASGALRLDPRVPTVLVIHALTGHAAPGGPQGWWSGVVGAGEPLDPTRHRIVSVALIGGCYGSSGPGDADFPRQTADRVVPGDHTKPTKGAFALDATREPATLTTWDQARAVLVALDHLGVERLELVCGGSVGAMVAGCVAALVPDRVARLGLFGGCTSASPWIVGFNHVGAQVVRALRDRGDATLGLALARQLAMLTYRAEPSLEDRHPRVPPTAWRPGAPHRVETWLTHHGDKLVERFDADAYLALLGAMSHHDLRRDPGLPQASESWRAFDGPPVARIRASTVAVGIDTDQLYLPEHMHTFAAELAASGVVAFGRTLRSRHGHDAFLIETPQVRAFLGECLGLPPASLDL